MLELENFMLLDIIGLHWFYYIVYDNLNQCFLFLFTVVDDEDLRLQIIDSSIKVLIHVIFFDLMVK